jgi:hypothetical protein
VSTDEEDDGPATVKYLILQQGGEFVIELPAEYKLTFGAVNPGGQMGPRDLHCLRVYDGANTKTSHLRAVYCDVRGFRDLSIPLARKVQKETGSTSWTMDSEGGFETTRKRELLSEGWIEPDDPDDIPF